jgi:dTDP-4-dehydrorhamnose 3,5-epimerase
MRFTPAPLLGAFIVDVERHEDARGFFARTFCEQEFAAHGIVRRPMQSNVSFNAVCGTLRGMHFQRAPHAEAKLVRCTAGKIFDVIVDVREDSPTQYKWFGIELDSQSQRALYIPEGFAHGFQTLADATEVFYEMFNLFQPGYDDGLRWDDPVLAIKWPIAVESISNKDLGYQLLKARV